MQNHEQNVVKFEKLKNQYEHLNKFYKEVVDEIQEVANQTQIQPVMYFEQENFQSIKILGKENFSYPFVDRKLVKSAVKAVVAENDTTKELTNHDIYLLNQVVCLEDEWNKPFKFIGDAIQVIERFMNKSKSDDLYECDEPIMKLNLDKIETQTKQLELKKYNYKVEPIMKFGIYLSSQQKLSSRQTP